LPKPIFTPATKAAQGEHDENVTFDEVIAAVGAEEAQQLRRLTLAVYQEAATIALSRGIIVADTKLEFGIGRRGPHAGLIVLADEVLTPDSSRFWPADSWAPGSEQPSFDKQYVRDWLLSAKSEWDRDSGQPPPPLPNDVIERTRERYIAAYQQLTGKKFT
jgi:phosphoribosylaminoimidazole-succinocarboxamide synthase